MKNHILTIRIEDSQEVSDEEKESYKNTLSRVKSDIVKFVKRHSELFIGESVSVSIDNIGDVFCRDCIHWQRNENFPNRLGKCKWQHPYLSPGTGITTHEDYGCIGGEK